ncbi:MAG: N-acetylmuramoyl-L-alanine amidase [Stellaceae bacterium]
MSPLVLRDRPSPNHAGRGAARIDMLVLHYTGMTSAAAALQRLCDPAARVSAHYLVDEDGALWRLVPEARRAFHAGVSFWQGDTDLNPVSIGVEIVNPGHEWGYRPFPQAQMAAVLRLCGDILARHPIPPDRVVGHSDIAPERKTDPGELFGWAGLAKAGIGIWPAPIPAQGRGRAIGVMEQAAALADLAAIGYRVDAGHPAPALIAFQRRFRPERWDGRLDGESAQRLAQVRAACEAARRRLS